MKKIAQALAWYFITLFFILLNIVGFTKFYQFPQKKIEQSYPGEAQFAVGNEADEGEIKGAESTAKAEDGRAEIVAKFLEKYNSPLRPYDEYGQKLVDIADHHDLDFRFLPAIMMEESNLCSNIPEGTYNCLGFGIHESGTLGFATYEAGWERAARELRANYVEEGRIKVSEIARKYTVSVDTWTNSVNQWMTEMEYDDRQKGIEQKSDANVLEYVQ